MLATIAVVTKANKHRSTLIAGLVNLLESKGFEVNIREDHIIISGDAELIIPEPVNQEMAMSVSKPMGALATAINIVHGDREQTYGDAGKNLRTIAAYWNVHINAAKSIDPRLTEDDVCGMMRLLKEARLATNPQHRDSLVDVAGYVELQDVVNQQKQTS